MHVTRIFPHDGCGGEKNEDPVPPLTFRSGVPSIFVFRSELLVCPPKKTRDVTTSIDTFTNSSLRIKRKRPGFFSRSLLVLTLACEPLPSFAAEKGWSTITDRGFVQIIDISFSNTLWREESWANGKDQAFVLFSEFDCFKYLSLGDSWRSSKPLWSCFVQNMKLKKFSTWSPFEEYNMVALYTKRSDSGA